MVERDHYFQSSADYAWVVCRLKRLFFQVNGIARFGDLDLFF